MTTLTTTEQSDLKKYEALIERGYQSFVESGQALLNIRDGRLYRHTHDTFEDYCQERWGFNRNRGLQLINAAIAVQELPKRLTTNVVTEGAARELHRVPREQRAEVVASATKNGVATGAAIKKAAEKVQQKSPIDLDSTGYPITKECAGIWVRKQEIQDLMTQISKVKNRISEGHNTGDPLFMPIKAFIKTHLEGAYYCLAQSKPYAVCTQCQGHPNINKEPCSFCSGTGMISEHAYTTQVPAEIKAIRQKSNSKK